MRNPKDTCAFATAVALVLAACSPRESAEAPTEPARLKLPDKDFTIAMIPDPQNYVSFDHQRARDFPFNAADQYFDQMRYVAANSQSMGGDIAFMTVVGDMWNHQSQSMNSNQAQPGIKRAPGSVVDQIAAPTEWTRAFEMPTSRRGTAMVDGKLPFSVVPGDHDHDARWRDSRHPPKLQGTISPEPAGQIHSGGLTNFVAIYGANSQFFKGKPWYVAANDGGADSAQVFEAAGYRWLHIGLQFRPPDSSLNWASGVLAKYPGLPTIVTTHDHLDGAGKQEAEGDNNPASVWQKFLSKHDQIFLVLSGHRAGQSRRVDKNEFGHDVHQIMADYQERFQSAIDANYTPDSRAGIGDGWMRLLKFNMAGIAPMIEVRTYSTHYHRYSRDLPGYAQWYRTREQPKLTDEEFLDAENFVLTLEDFRARFDATAKVARAELEAVRP